MLWSTNNLDFAYGTRLYCWNTTSNGMSAIYQQDCDGNSNGKNVWEEGIFWIINNSYSVSSILPSCNNMTFSLAKTSYSLNVYANKTTGSQSSSSRGFSIDSTNPQITMQSPSLPPDNTYNTNNVSLSYTASDLFLDTCVRELDGVNTTITPKCANQTMSLLADGTHIVKVFVNDTVNNTNVTTSRTFYVDTAAPLIDIQSPGDGVTYGSLNTTLNYTINHPPPGVLDKCWYKLNGGANVSLPNCENITFLAINNSNTITVYANDTGNNIGNHTHTFTTDITPPSTNIVMPLNTTYYGLTTLNLTYTASDPNGVTCSYQLNGTGYTTIPSCNNITFDSLHTGFFVLDLRTVDNFGNTAIIERNFTMIHGINVSAILGNGTIFTTWNLSATNGTNTTTFNITTANRIIPSTSLPQGSVVLTASKFLYSSVTFNVTVNDTMTLVGINFTLAPQSYFYFYDNRMSIYLTNWWITFVNSTGGVYNNSVPTKQFTTTSNLIAGQQYVTAYKLGYFPNPTLNQTFNNYTSYNITFYTNQTAIVISGYDEISHATRVGWNGQFRLHQTNQSAVSVSGYRGGTAPDFCYDNLPYNDTTGYCVSTGACSSYSSPSTSSQVTTIQAEDYNYAVYQIDYRWKIGRAHV